MSVPKNWQWTASSGEYPSVSTRKFMTKARCFRVDRNGGFVSTPGMTPVRTARIRVSGFADCLVRQSDMQTSVRTCAKSSIEPEHDSLRSIWIMCIVSRCSGRCVVATVVTRLFASVRRCKGATSPLMSIHKPRKHWHVPKHFMTEYSSATVVDKTVRLIFWDS